MEFRWCPGYCLESRHYTLALRTALEAIVGFDLIELSCLLSIQESSLTSKSSCSGLVPTSLLSCVGDQLTEHECPLVVHDALVLNPDEGSGLGLGS